MDNPENSVRIGFSEPVRFNNFVSMRQSRSLVLTNGDEQDSMFLAHMVVRADKKDILMSADSLESWNYIGREQYMMLLELVINPEYNSFFRHNHSRIRFALDSTLTSFADIIGNIPTFEVGNEVTLSVEHGSAPYLCEDGGLTLASISKAVTFQMASDGRTPLFPWFGVSINMQAISRTLPRNNRLRTLVSNGQNYVLMDFDTIKPMVTIAVTVFDPLGNLVASPATHSYMKKEITAADIRSFLNINATEEAIERMALKELQSHFEVTRSGTPIEPDILRSLYPPSVTLGYDYFVREHAKSNHCCGYPNFPLPVWNCVNRRGRVVATGGYIAKVSVHIAGETRTVTRKLLLTR